MMQQTWDSRSIDPPDRVDTIRTMLCENLVRTDLTLDPQGREAHVNVSYQDIGQLRALSVKTVPSLAALAMRPQRMIMSDDDESLFVVFQRGNRSMLRRGDDQTVMTPGSIVVYPSTSPYVHAFDEDADRMIVEVPLGVVGLTADQIGEVSGVDLRERTSLAALLQSVLGGVMDSELSLRDEVDVFAPVADLLKVTLLSALTPDRATTRYPLAEQIVTYVLDNLTDPGLGAARIAKDLHMSERLLYAEMSRADIRLAQLIQSQRLRRVRDALTAPTTIDVPIGVLAQQHGFVSASHFSRIFREEFGTTPRQWRNTTIPRPDETQDESRLDLPQQIRPEAERALEVLIARALDRRAQARTAGDFRTADRIRDELDAAGIVLSDSKSGTAWNLVEGVAHDPEQRQEDSRSHSPFPGLRDQTASPRRYQQ